MSEGFYRLPPFPAHRGPLSGTHETRYWTNFRNIAETDHQSSINHIEFSPRSPYEIAVSASSRITLLDAHYAKSRRVLSRGIKSTALCGSFRKDGLLLAAGTEEGVVSVYRLADWALTRKMKAHHGAVHTALFSADGLRVISGSDDRTVKVWDLATSQCLATLKQAQDYVRTQSPSPASSHLWATGSYDGKARVYDFRSQKCIFTLDHGSQIDGLVLMPGGARAVTVGGTDVNIWDFFAGGKCLKTIQTHSKAVTCARVTTSGKRLLTSGLDSQIKVYDTDTYDVVTSMRFKSQVLSFDISPDERRYAVGMVSGKVIVRGRRGFRDELPAANLNGGLKERALAGVGRGREKQYDGPRVGSLKYYLRGADVGPTDDTDLFVKKRKWETMKGHDKFLQRFEYAKALDHVMRHGGVDTIIGLIEELMARDALRGALGGRNESTLVPIIRLVSDNILIPRYTFTLTIVAEIIVDLYAGVLGHSAEFDRLFWSLRLKLVKEVRLQRNLLKLGGSLDLLMSAAASS